MSLLGYVSLPTNEWALRRTQGVVTVTLKVDSPNDCKTGQAVEEAS
jgi:hypothetical protein